MRLSGALVFGLLALGLASNATAADVETISCDTTEGWSILDGTAGAGRPELSVGEPWEGRGSVQLRHQRVRGTACALIHPSFLTGLRRLHLRVRVDRNTLLLLSVTDRDGARFHATRPVEAGDWRHLSFAATEFAPAQDSPVKKPSLDPQRLAFGLGILDASGMLGETGANTLRVDALTIDREDLPATALPAVIEGRVVEAGESGRHEGDVTIKAGGVLRLTAPRFVLAGSLRLEGGTLEIVGCAVTFESAFPHQRKIDLGEGARAIVRDSVFANRFLPAVDVRGGATFAIDRGTFVGGGMSTTIHDGGSVTVRAGTGPGELMIFPGARVALEDVTFALLWIALGDNAKGRVSLPEPKRIEDWRLDPALRIDVSVVRCAELMWGLISMPGSDVVVENTRFLAAGITLWGQEEITGLRNGDGPASTRLALGDRRLELAGCTVRTWNVYAAPRSKVTLRNCRLGEIWSMGDAELTLIDSECDGTGGYVKAQDDSVLRMTGCTVDAEVIARERARMELTGCTVRRDLSASGQAKVTLKQTRIQGKVQRIDGGTVVEQN